MKKAYAVIGANFGDEGKGLMTDYFCRTNANVINIRINGGAQAGHTVCTREGKRHVFSHIGSGSFAGANTYLCEYFIVNPMLFSKEFRTLGYLGQTIYIDWRCLVTLPCDMLINQFLEKQRGKDRHGSCGVGIYETILRNEHKRYALNYSDMLTALRCDLGEQIDRINREYVPWRIEKAGITGKAKEELLEMLANGNLTENYLDDFYFMQKCCRDADERVIELYDTAVFEGAQGLMLDKDREDYFPHLTPSSTGMKNIRAILDRLKKREVEVCYVTRSFFTRHGAGRFDTESKKIQKAFGLYDKTNAPNEYQGNFRYGWFDISEFMASLAYDRRYVKAGEKISVAVTHLDMSMGKILFPSGMLEPSALAFMAGADRLYKASGETAYDIIAASAAGKLKNTMFLGF